MVAIEGGRWEIYVGGAAGAHIRKGDLLTTVDDAELVKTLVGRFMQYYRENAKWLERTYAFVPRVGLEKIRAIVVDDSEGIGGRSGRSGCRPRSTTYVDPWLDRDKPRCSRPIPDLAAPGGSAEGADSQRAGRANPVDSGAAQPPGPDGTQP